MKSFILLFIICFVLCLGCGDSTKDTADTSQNAVKPKEYTKTTKEEVARLIKKYGDVNGVDTKKGFTPLHDAINNNKEGALEIMELLIEKGADVNGKDKDGFTPLHNIAKDEKMKHREEKIKLLVKNGADVNVRNKAGGIPLLCAIGSKKINLIKALVENGADVNMKSLCGETPLDMAMSFEKKGMKEIIDLLRKHGAKRGKKNGPGGQPAPPEKTSTP